jgi:hypothetical protein
MCHVNIVAWKIPARFEYQVPSAQVICSLKSPIQYHFQIRTVAWLDFDRNNFQLIVHPLHERVCGKIHAGALQLEQ